MEKEFFTLLGLGVPFSLAAATYAVFAWLDGNAPDEATTVISSWLHGRSQNKPDLGNLIIKTFDRIYTSPLLSFRAFRRSAVISVSCWLFVYFVPSIGPMLRSFNVVPWLYDHGYISEFLINLGVIVIIDYISSLFVRRFLELARFNPVKSSIVSSVIGSAIVLCGYFIYLFFSVAVHDLMENLSEGIDIGYIMNDSFNFAWQEIIIYRAFFDNILPAFVIHLGCLYSPSPQLLVKLLYLMFRAVERAQWFLKQGDAHPLKAIGIVATIIVFGSAMLVKEGWALLGFLERS